MYNDSDSESLETLETIENTVRAQVLEHVSPKIARLGARSLAEGLSEEVSSSVYTPRPDGDAGVEGGFLIVLSSVLAVDSFVSKTPLPAHRFFYRKKDPNSSRKKKNFKKLCRKTEYYSKTGS